MPADPPSRLAALSNRRDDDIAVECGDRKLTWAELDERSTRVGRGLEALGAEPGAHVAICVSNRLEFVESVLGAWRAGCAYTPVKTGWTADEVGALLDDASTAVVVTDRDGARLVHLGLPFAFCNRLTRPASKEEPEKLLFDNGKTVVAAP